MDSDDETLPLVGGDLKIVNLARDRKTCRRPSAFEFAAPPQMSEDRARLVQRRAEVSEQISSVKPFAAILDQKMRETKDDLRVEEKREPFSDQAVWNLCCHLESLEIHRAEFIATIELGELLMVIVDDTAADAEVAQKKVELLDITAFMVQKHYATALQLTSQPPAKWNALYLQWGKVRRLYRRWEKQFQQWRSEHPTLSKMVDGGVVVGVAGGLTLAGYCAFVAFNLWHPLGWIIAGASVGGGVLYLMFRYRRTNTNTQYWNEIKKVRADLAGRPEEFKRLCESLNAASNTFLGFWEREFPDVVPEIPLLRHIDNDVCAICTEAFEPPLLGLTSCKHVYHKRCLNATWEKTGHFCPLCRSTGNRVNVVAQTGSR